MRRLVLLLPLLAACPRPVIIPDAPPMVWERPPTDGGFAAAPPAPDVQAAPPAVPSWVAQLEEARQERDEARDEAEALAAKRRGLEALVARLRAERAAAAQTPVLGVVGAAAPPPAPAPAPPAGGMGVTLYGPNGAPTARIDCTPTSCPEDPIWKNPLAIFLGAAGAGGAGLVNAWVKKRKAAIT